MKVEIVMKANFVDTSSETSRNSRHSLLHNYKNKHWSVVEQVGACVGVLILRAHVFSEIIRHGCLMQKKKYSKMVSPLHK